MTIDPEETGNTGFWKATGDKRCTQRTIGLYNTVLSHPLPQQVRGVGRQVLQPAAICQPKLASDLTRGCLCCCCSKVTTEGYASTVVCLCAQYFLSCLAPAPIPFVKNLFSKPASSLSAQAMEHARVNFIFHIFFPVLGVSYTVSTCIARPLPCRCCKGATRLATTSAAETHRICLPSGLVR